MITGHFVPFIVWSLAYISPSITAQLAVFDPGPLVIGSAGGSRAAPFINTSP
jgi:hypothetical protein